MKKTYKSIGTVKAEPMTLGSFAQKMGKELDPDNNIKETDGFCIERNDGSIEWQPKSLFMSGFVLVNDFLDRLIVERNELSERLENLDHFIHESEVFKDLDTEQANLLLRQKDHMREYLSILNKRISLFL